MKKILSMLLVLLMSLQFAGCSPSKEDLKSDAKLLSGYITRSSMISASYNVGTQSISVSDIETALAEVKELKNTVDTAEWLTEKYEELAAKFSSGLDKLIQSYEKAKVANTDGPYYDLTRESLKLCMEYLEIAQECMEECGVDIVEEEE